MKNKFFAVATLIVSIFCANIKSEIINRNYSLIRRCIKSNIALVNSVSLNKIEEATRLIKSGADINAIDKNGETALLKAIVNKNAEMTKLLLENGADPNRYGTAPFYNSGHTPLALAVGNNNVEITKILLDSGAQPDECFYSPFFICSRVTPQIFYAMLSHRKNAYWKDKGYYEKLFCDISTTVCKTKEILQLLIDNGNDFDALEGLVLEESFGLTAGKYRTVFEGTPLMLFIKGKNRVLTYLFSMIEHLKKSKKISDLQKVINFTNQIKLTLNQEIEIVCQNCYVNTTNRSGQSALTIAFDDMDIETIKILICNGANRETPLNKGDKTILKALAEKKYLNAEEQELAKFLLKHGAYINTEYDNINNDQIKKLISEHENTRPTKEKKQSIYEINTTVTQENIDTFIKKYSTNHYELQNKDSKDCSSKCDKLEKWPCKYDSPNDYCCCEGCRKNYLAKYSEFPEPKMGH